MAQQLTSENASADRAVRRKERGMTELERFAKTTLGPMWRLWFDTDNGLLPKSMTPRQAVDRGLACEVLRILQRVSAGRHAA